MASASPSWPPVTVTQRLLEHKALIELLRVTADADLQAALARYLVVRSAGLIEAVRDDVTDQHCSIVGPPRLHSRISSGLRGGLGTTPSQLLDFVGTLDADWRDRLRVFLAEDDFARSNNLGALVTARKKVAHGDGEQISTGKALRWAQTAQEIAKWLVRTFDPRVTT